MGDRDASDAVAAEALDAGNGDWLLTSLQPFHSDELLTVQMGSGEKYLIRVTDAEYLTNIKDLLTDITLMVDSEEVKPGETAAVRDGVTYNLRLKFKEDIEHQFSNDGPLTFAMPTGFDLPADFTTTLEISLGRRGKLYNPVTYDATTRQLIIRWDKSEPALFDYFTRAATASFELNLQSTVDLTKGQILFSDGAAINVEKQNPHNAKVTKTGELDQANGVVRYTVTVTSDGTTENLVLADEPGTALVYQKDCAWDQDASSKDDTAPESWSKHEGPTITNRGNTFQVTVPSMADGETLVFTYTSRIDVSNIEQSGHATFEETGNTVTIAGDDVPEDNTATHWEDKVEFSDLEKDVTGVGDTYKKETGVTFRRISWEIDTNRTPQLSFAGTTISDTIGEDVKSLCNYAGDGIVVEVYNAKHELVDTRPVSWSELGIDPATDKSWTYDIPAEDTLPYEYVVTYDTEINQDLVNSGGKDVYVTNYAEGKGGEDVAMEIIHPKGTGLGV